MTEETVRLSVPISKSFHEQLQKYLPWGVKAEVIRSLLELFIDAHERDEDFHVVDLLKGRYKLVRSNFEQETNNG